MSPVPNHHLYCIIRTVLVKPHLCHSTIFFLFFFRIFSWRGFIDCDLDSQIHGLMSRELGVLYMCKDGSKSPVHHPVVPHIYIHPGVVNLRLAS